MKKLRKLDSFGLECHAKDIASIVGGVQTGGGGTATAPETTMVANNPKCSDSQVKYDNDKGESTGSCTTYSCP